MKKKLWQKKNNGAKVMKLWSTPKSKIYQEKIRF